MGGVHMAPNVGNAVSFGEISSSAMMKSGLQASMSSEVTTAKARWPSFSAAHLKRRLNAIWAEFTKLGQLSMRAMSMSECGIRSESPARLRRSSWSVELLGGCGANRLRGWGQESLCARPGLNPCEGRAHAERGPLIIRAL